MDRVRIQNEASDKSGISLAVQIMSHFNGRIKKIFYFDSSLLQNLICIAYDFLYPSIRTA